MIFHSDRYTAEYSRVSGNLASEFAVSDGIIRPTFYLKSNVAITSGDGSISSPYRLQLS